LTASVIRSIIALRRFLLTNITFLLIALLVPGLVFSPMGEPDGPVTGLVFPDPCFLGALAVGHCCAWGVVSVAEMGRERRRRKKQRELEVGDVVCRDGEGYESGTRVELYTVS
jgi:hypothetical protein